MLAYLPARNAVRWDKAKLTRASEFGLGAARLVALAAKYQAIEGKDWRALAFHRHDVLAGVLA